MTNGRRDRQVFVDTSAFFALFDDNDSQHQAGIAIQMRLILEAWNLVTTNFILAETHALTLSRLG